MQKQSFDIIPYMYRPYDFSSDFPMYAFLGEHWKIQPHQPEYLHFHNALEIGHCLDGNGILYHGNSGSDSYTSGNFSIIFPQVPHIATALNKPASWEYLYIDVKALLKDKSSATNQLWQVFYMLQRIPFIINEEYSSSLYHYLKRIFWEFHQKKPYYQDAVSGLLLSFFAELNRIATNMEWIAAAESQGAFSYIHKALSYIYDHYNEPLSIQDLSAYCCISESHFRRIFKSIVGISPLEYIQHYRIQQACHYLHLNQEPINLIANRVGYTSLSSFNRQFQQYIHSSPSEWKKEHLYTPYSHEVHSYEESDTRHIFQI